MIFLEGIYLVSPTKNIMFNVIAVHIMKKNPVKIKHLNSSSSLLKEIYTICNFTENHEISKPLDVSQNITKNSFY